MRVSINDLWESYKKINVALFFAWSDTKARYKRSILGPFWLVLGTAISILGVGFLWGKILKINYSDFFPSLVIGLILWQFISGCITDAPSMFTRNAVLIRNIPLPWSFFGVQLLLKQLINFFHNMTLVILTLCIFPIVGYKWVILQALPGFALLLGNLLWILLLIAMIGARYRDIEPLLNSLMPIFFFLTPVIYKPNNLGALQIVAWLNPFTYLITLVRAPLLGSPVPVFVWVDTSIAFFAGWSGTLFILSKKYRRLPFWI